MAVPRIGVIMSTVRPQRFGDKPAAWLMEIAAQRTDLAFELIDLRDFPLPLFDWPSSPAATPVDTPGAKRWAARIDELDGYIFVLAEYLHSFPGVLKNALDHVYKPFNRKVAAFISYGAVGGARSVEAMRLVCADLQMATVRPAVHIGRDAIIGIRTEGKALTDFPFYATQAAAMLEDLSWWATTLKAGRDAMKPAA